MLIVDNNTVQADDYSVICMLFRFVVNGQKHTEVLIHLFKLRKQIGWAATKRRSWGLIYVIFIFQAVREMSAAEASPPLHPHPFCQPLYLLLLLLSWWRNPHSPRRTSWASFPKWAHQIVVTVNTEMPALSCPSLASQAVSSHINTVCTYGGIEPWKPAKKRIYHFAPNKKKLT